jgi:hypothetical protein
VTPSSAHSFQLISQRQQAPAADTCAEAEASHEDNGEAADAAATAGGDGEGPDEADGL